MGGIGGWEKAARHLALHSSSLRLTFSGMPAYTRPSSKSTVAKPLAGKGRRSAQTSYASKRGSPLSMSAVLPAVPGESRGSGVRT